MKYTTLSSLMLCLMLTSLTGCNTLGADQSVQEPGYRTIPVQLGRETEKAKQLTAEAVDAYQKGEVERAEQLLLDALTADVMHGPAHNNLGKLYYHQSRYYEAAWEFQYAIRLMPNQPVPRNNLGMVFEATGQLDHAAEQYSLAIAEEPDSAELLGNLARVRVRLGHTGPEIRKLLQQIVMKDNRPEWREWAKLQYHMQNRADD